MTLINITHSLEDSEFFERFLGVTLSGVVSRFSAEEFLMVNDPLADFHEFRLRRAVSDDGELFENLSFLIDARFSRGDDVYIQGGGFRLNFSAFMRDARSVLGELES